MRLTPLSSSFPVDSCQQPAHQAIVTVDLRPTLGQFPVYAASHMAKFFAFSSLYLSN